MKKHKMSKERKAAALMVVHEPRNERCKGAPVQNPASHARFFRWWEYKPVEQDADKEIEELSKIRKPGSKAENKDEKVFGPFPSSQVGLASLHDCCRCAFPSF